MIVQGRERMRFGSVNYFYDPYHHLVIKRGLRFAFSSRDSAGVNTVSLSFFCSAIGA